MAKKSEKDIIKDTVNSPNLKKEIMEIKESVASIGSNQTIDQFFNFPATEINNAISEAKGERHILYDGNRLDYSCNEHEFKTLKKGAKNLWKDLTVLSIGLFVPFFANFLNCWGEGIELSTGGLNKPFFWNLLFAIVFFGFSAGFGFAWKQSKSEIDEVIKKVEDKPKYSV